jgi:hypothetical protein
MHARTTRAAAAIALAVAIGSHANAQVATFDSGLEGWTTSDSLGSTTHSASGGNTGGYLRHDNSELEFSILLAPASFVGNLSSFIGGTLSFDGIQIEGGGQFFDGPNRIPDGNVYDDYGTIVISGPGGTAKVDLLPNGATPQLGQWQTYGIALTGAAWGMSDADFASMMANVQSLTINLEGLYGPEINGVDNIALRAGVAPVPEPQTYALMLAGLAAVAFAARRRRAGSAP